MNAHKAMSAAFRPFKRVGPKSANLDERTALFNKNREQVDGSPTLVPPAGVTFVPTEAALLLTVTLPKMATSQRKAAVQFAVEDKIAQSLDLVHVVLGPKVLDHGNSAEWLVAVISSAVLDEYIKFQPGDDNVLLLDVLALQVPTQYAWTVLETDGRVLVRLPDWSGFATTPTMLPLFWKAAGSPKIVLVSGMLPDDVQVVANAALEKTLDPQILKFDLRSAQRRPGAAWPKGARALATVLVVALSGHLALLGLDIFGLKRIESAQKIALSQALEAAGQPVAGDVEDSLAAILTAQSKSRDSDFLPLLAKSFVAISGQSGQLQIRDLRFAAAQKTLTMTIEAGDLASLQAAETAFAAADLDVTAGAATTKDGAAEAQMTLRRAVP